MDGRITFDDARQQRTFVHVIEARRKLQARVRSLITSRSAEPINSTSKLLVVEDEVAKSVGFLLVELVSLHGGEHGAKNFRPENVGKSIGTFLGQPEEQFAAGLVLADQPGQRSL